MSLLYNGELKQCLSVAITCNDHESCLRVTNAIKKQCDAWYFCVRYDEAKSARKGDVLSRSLTIYQTAYTSDIIIFKEAVRRICLYFERLNYSVVFTDRGTEPVQ